MPGGGSEVVGRRARILLQADEAGPGWTDRQISAAYSCRRQTVENVRRRFVLEGFEAALERKRRATARPRRTKADWAREVGELLEGRYAVCERITLVSDNLNTHTRGAFYEVFEPARARALVRRIEFCHTPKHGSWLNVAESELSCMTRQCLKHRRFGDIETLRSEIAAWSADINDTQRGVDWQMTVGDARRKLKSIYPQIKL